MGGASGVDVDSWERPWCIDDWDKWLNRLEGDPFRRVCVFVDNSGADIILGVLPFCREFLKQGSTVILCANREPVLNDVTCRELAEIIERTSGFCPVINKAVEQERLKIAENGQTSCCLDLRFLPEPLVEVMLGVDLIVLVGMARAAHTNLCSKFTCDSLKVAVIKDEWFAQKLGGPLFAPVVKYDRALDK